jgi:hypothetical protein
MVTFLNTEWINNLLLPVGGSQFPVSKKTRATGSLSVIFD